MGAAGVVEGVFAGVRAMAELTNSDKLQPSLLDRLMDDEPDKKVEGRDKRVMSMRVLRQAVLRDLSWLLNTGNRPRGDEIYEHPVVARSVVNYGMPDLTGLAAAGIEPAEMERQVREAIIAFEPRIVARTLQVRIRALGTAGEAKAGNRVGFEINGELCPLPMPEVLYLRTEVDLESGQVEVRDRA